MRSLWNEEAYAEIVARIRALTPDTRARWGRMNASRMLAHISDQIRMALGDIAARRGSGFLSVPPINRLMIYVVPWPKGARGPQEAFTTAPESWGSDLQQLLVLVDRLREKRHHQLWPEHPMFGKLSGDDWAALSYKHLNHHLTQFGV